MDIILVEGQDKGDILLYTLSTCVWCRKMKRWLNEAGYAYRYVDVDLEPGGDDGPVMEEVRKWNPACSFPTVVVKGSECFAGFKPERLEELLSA
jgi:glutaredoxin